MMKKSLVAYLKVLAALLVMIWLLGLFEVITTFKETDTVVFILKVVLYKLLHAVITVLIIGALLFPLYCLLGLGNKKIAEILLVVLGMFLVIGEFSLVKYSTTTLLNLGADLLGYSYADIYKTIASSKSFSIVNYLFILTIPLLFLVLVYLFKKKIPAKPFLKTILGLLILALPLKFFNSEFNETVYQTKISFLAVDILKFKLDKLQTHNYQPEEANEYPLLKSSEETKDVLGPFFNRTLKKPNIVVIVMEGLGTEFVDGNSYSGFTPYLDNLITQSLYWENFVSNTGRTFGILPSLLGSLPFGDTGFLELKKTPSHLSLFNILKANGYTTSYYTGTQSSFDKIINFLEYNSVDFIVDENKYGPSYVKTGGVDGFSWGYPDAEMFKKVVSTLKNKKQPRLDVIATLSNHEPFVFPEKETYKKKVDSILNTSRVFGVSKREIANKKDIYATLLYSDHSLKNFMESYQERADFMNTIFVITGDHRLIPIEQKDKLCRFHVPLLIYSPMLKKAQRFKSVSSHLDVAPSIYSFLTNNYTFEPLKQTAWLGIGLDTTKSFRNIHHIGLMRYKGGLKDFIYGEYLFSDGELYKIDHTFETHPINNDKILSKVKKSFEAFKAINKYVTEQDKIYPDVLYERKQEKIQFTEGEQKIIREVTEGKTFDEVFLIARSKAFDGDRVAARLLCDFILNNMPNHADARILKGRTLSWDGNYKEAEKLLLNAVERHPFYDDAYIALLDLYWWSGKETKSIVVAQEAYVNEIKNPEISFKLAKAYQRLQQKREALKIIDSLLTLYPDNKEYVALEKILKE
ncbi:sulfatase-like hydrolase/transferase [Tenacibaculum sp. FZY0031]|uniref:sulfatase-like hydrolase/transferase n=1 Tax=Tenacibaculum sp. FZY0031 TaxID=3116648 RepID=UPI002EB9069C|nr:sulfatase-like hydrolase/transferase [Tenacibaculum sp. FZY0031]